jgi:LemA protein
MKGIAWIIWIIALIALYGIGWYNNIITAQWTLVSTEAQVNNMYDRRKDLVPQVAAVVKKYAQYESRVLVGVTELRTQSANLDKLNAMVAQWDVKSSDFSSLLASTMWWIKISMEAYPTLKADTQFTNLYTTLEWSENRIRTSIKDYNDMVGAYNARLMLIPGRLFNALFNFPTKSLINPPADKNIKEVPNVDKLLE